MEENNKNKKKNKLVKKILRLTKKLQKRGGYVNNNESSYDQKLSYTKKVVAFVLINAEIQIYFSYLLGFLGKDNIAEELSTQVVITVLGAIGFYCIKSLIENLSKYNIGYLTSQNDDACCSEDEEDCDCNTAEEFFDEVEQYMN